MTNNDMLQLFDRFNVLFFFGALEVQFEWANLPEENRAGQYVCKDDLIQMTPSCIWENDTKDARRRTRITIFLHEITHGLFFQYACRHCPTYLLNVENAAYHGRAFMIVSTALEKAYKRLFGEDISVAGPECWRLNWEDVHHLPSIHDVTEWRWVEKQMERDKRVRERLRREVAARAKESSVHPESGETHRPASISSTLAVCGDAVYSKWTTRYIYRRCKVLLAQIVSQAARSRIEENVNVGHCAARHTVCRDASAFRPPRFSPRTRT